MTEKEQFLNLILKERIDNVVNEVLSQAMLDPGHDIPEAVGAFDKNWVKKIIVVEVDVDHNTNRLYADELAEHIRGELIDALENLADGRAYAIVDIGYEWNAQGILCVTYVLSAEKNLFAEWEEVTDNDVLHAVGKYLADITPELVTYRLRYAGFEINVNA